MQKKLTNKLANKTKGQGMAVTVLNVIILVICVLIVVVAIAAVKEYRYASRNDLSEDHYLWALEDDNFAQILHSYYIDTKRTQKKEVYYAVAEYFEAASFYHAYVRTGDAKQAEKYRERMEQAAGRMGAFSVVKNKIDAKFEDALK